MSVDGRTPHGASRDLPSVGDLPSARDLPAAVVVGLMSGTSADGIDTVTVRLERRDGRLLWEVLGRAAHAYPPLTTISQPKYHMGKLAVQTLRRMSENQSGMSSNCTFLEIPLIVRESTAPPPM